MNIKKIALKTRNNLKQYKIKHGHMLDALSKANGFEDWNAYSALMPKKIFFDANVFETLILFEVDMDSKTFHKEVENLLKYHYTENTNMRSKMEIKAEIFNSDLMEANYRRYIEIIDGHKSFLVKMVGHRNSSTGLAVRFILDFCGRNRSLLRSFALKKTQMNRDFISNPKNEQCFAIDMLEMILLYMNEGFDKTLIITENGLKFSGIGFKEIIIPPSDKENILNLIQLVDKKSTDTMPWFKAIETKYDHILKNLDKKFEYSTKLNTLEYRCKKLGNEPFNIIYETHVPTNIP